MSLTHQGLLLLLLLLLLPQHQQLLPLLPRVRLLLLAQQLEVGLRAAWLLYP